MHELDILHVLDILFEAQYTALACLLKSRHHSSEVFHYAVHYELSSEKISLLGFSQRTPMIELYQEIYNLREEFIQGAYRQLSSFSVTLCRKMSEVSMAAFRKEYCSTEWSVNEYNAVIRNYFVSNEKRQSNLWKHVYSENRFDVYHELLRHDSQSDAYSPDRLLVQQLKLYLKEKVVQQAVRSHFFADKIFCNQNLAGRTARYLKHGIFIVRSVPKGFRRKRICPLSSFPDIVDGTKRKVMFRNIGVVAV